MSILYDFPIAAKHGQIIPKYKIYELATPTAPTTKVKKLFTQEINKIIWAYVLAERTINLPASKNVEEIAILTISLKIGTISHDILHCIDKSIAMPIIFVLHYNNKIQYVAAYKRPNEVDKSKWVLSSYFASEWIADSTERTPLPVQLNMGALYHALLLSIIPHNPRCEESLDVLVARLDIIQSKEREAERLIARIHKEKQFNRKVELNSLLNVLKQEIVFLRA